MFAGGTMIEAGRKWAMNFDEAAIEKIKNLIYERSHLSFLESREIQLRRWLAQRIEEGGFCSLDEYYRALTTDDSEFWLLISLITTKETYFFRMPEQFEVLADTVLPEIIDREGRTAMSALARGETYRMRLRAWSAGCATGQEAYSLAMQILDTIHYPKAWDMKVIATDINAEVLEIARIGRYDTMRLGKMPPRFIEKFFQISSADSIMVNDEVREIMEFRVFNLRYLDETAAYRNFFDIIFCRNVMIYFDLAAQQRLVDGLARCLRPGGYLFTGEGEVLHLYRHNLEIIDRGSCIFYRKTED